MIRPATVVDIPALLEIERASFPGDRISPRSLRHLLTGANAATLLDTAGDALRGYVMLLFRAGLARARIYSIATHPAHQGQGVAARLLLAAERLARARGCADLRLEIRTDNQPSLRLFQRHGYSIFGRYCGYYEDGRDAYRLAKPISPRTRSSPARHFP